MAAASSFKRIRFQCYALLSCAFSMISAGTNLGWMSPALFRLTEDTSSITISPSEKLWMSSLIYIGIIIGSIVFALIADRTGRKWINFIASAVYIVGWSLCIIAKSAALLLASRLILGFGVGFTFCIVPVYIGEVVENRLRGAFTAGMVAMLLLGFLYIFSLAAVLNFTLMNAVSLIFPLAALLTFFSMPESPHFEVMRHNYDKAEANLMRLRGENNRMYIIEELADIVQYLDVGFLRQPIGRKFKLLQLRKAAFSLMIIAVLVFTQCFSGMLTVMGNLHVAFLYDDPDKDEFIGIIIATSIGSVVSLWPLFFIDRLGRRTLFLISAVGCIISTTLIGTYYYLEKHEYLDNSYSWLLILGVLSFQFFFYSGLGCVPYIIASEIFPAFVRPLTTAFMVILLGIFGFIVTKLYNILGDNFGYHVSFWMFSGTVLAGTIFIYFFMPETKRKSFSEIQEAFQVERNIIDKIENAESH